MFRLRILQSGDYIFSKAFWILNHENISEPERFPEGRFMAICAISD
jgi:hypothetical protein